MKHKIRFSEFYIKEREKVKNKKVLIIVVIIIDFLLYGLVVSKDFWKNMVGGYPSVIEEFALGMTILVIICFLLAGFFCIFPITGGKNEDVKEEQQNKHKNESMEKESVEKKSEKTIK